MSINTLTIREQVAEFEASSPASAEGAVFGAENAKKVAAGLPEGISTPGDRFPDGNLLSAHGEGTSFTLAAGGKPSVVIFYRGAWCPFCNIALRTYNQTLADPLRELGVELIAISPQKPDGSLTMAEKNDLQFTVLSDPGNQIAGQLGILSSLSAAEVAAQKALGLDVEAVNADGTTTLDYPTTCLVNADGTIEWIDVHVDYTTRTEPEQILAAVNALLSK